jgi:drug/metabolite transporter (DMT)-like permease
MSSLTVRGASSAPDAALRTGSVHLQSALVFGAACFGIILFALVPSTTRIAAGELSGLSIGLIRAVGAGFFALPLLLVLRLRAPQKAEWGLLAIYALGNFAGFPILFAIGVHRTSGSHAALIMAAMPLFIGLIGMLLEGRLPRSIWFVGAAIAVGGEIALIGLGGMSRSYGASAAGDSIVFAACTLSAVGIVAGARLGSRIGPLSATMWAIVTSSTSLAPWAAIRLLTMPVAYQNISVATWGAVLQITLGAAVVANVSWLWAVARGGLVRVAPIQFAQPVCALLLASVLLNERLSTSLLLICVSIVLGTVISCRGARSKTATKAGPRQASAQARLQNAALLATAKAERIRALMELVQMPLLQPAAVAE